MTMIFYERNLLLNDDLVEVTNEEFLSKLKKDFLRNYSKFNSLDPFICGTVVNKAIGQPQFDRKLKMIPATIFTLLQLMRSDKFTSNPDH